MKKSKKKVFGAKVQGFIHYYNKDGKIGVFEKGGYADLVTVTLKK